MRVWKGQLAFCRTALPGNLAIVRETDLIATMPARLTLGLGPDLVTATLPLSVAGISYGMIWHPRTEASPAQRWLRGLILQGVGQKAG